MKRTTISLPDDVALIAAREARRRETSLSEVVRQALIEHLGLAQHAPREIPFAKLGRSGVAHTGRDFEDVLAREWAADIERHRDR
jgi:Arc/MetJ-type ribon-helix-helix transcriptional regulator